MCRPYGWVLGPKSSKQGSFFRQFLETCVVYPEIGEKKAKNTSFRKNSSEKWVWQQVSVIRTRYLSENHAADPSPSASHVPTRDNDLQNQFQR